ncbi:uroplakin-3b-like [Dendrobates tinctorius]|uniref:uroplakin-3b-like n=1 Tax=Dendrobates tinctorius TaxID=92724 RepID=UPI003CC96DD7
MTLHLSLLKLICHLSAQASSVSDYIPQIPQNFIGNLTDKSFFLDQPNCTFNDFPSTNVWVVIALNQSFSILNDSDFGTPVPYSAFKNGSYTYYHTLLVSAGKYPCSNFSDPGSIKLIKVGSTSPSLCTESQFCNGELSNDQSYRARFVLLDNMGVYDKTQWSGEIKLLKEKSFQGDTFWSSGRSGGMIVLTSILCVLLAILLVALIAALCTGGRDIYWKRSMDMKSNIASKMDFVSRTTYRTHYDHMHLVS